ncbi:hypothetical protein [Pseudomonas sp. IT-P176]|uniref:hypothetical protein n=1 Tax=Pseudomonas sp. IT-P176 TaxID=3026444 RepID=UPI0039E1E48B
MSTVFISGSIKIKSLDNKVKSRLNNVISSGLNVLVGDAGGVDKSVQQYFKEKYFSTVTVYCTGSSPRNNDGAWPVVNVEPPVKTKSRAYFTAKDLKMADDSDFGLMIWDCKSTGTLSNVIELLKQRKKSVVYVSSKKAFLNITTVSDLKQLIMQMDNESLIEAEKKISLSKKIEILSEGHFLDYPEIERTKILDKIKEHQDVITGHQRAIVELQAQLDELSSPMDDLFVN